MYRCGLFLALLILTQVVRVEAQQTLGEGLRQREKADNAGHDTLIVYFPFNSYLVADKTVMELRAYLQSPGWDTENIRSIRITGHTDSKGRVVYNKELSARRAKAVRDFIDSIVPSLSSDKFQLASMGAERPVSTIDSLNRRAAIIFSYTLKGRNKIAVAGKIDSGETHEMPQIEVDTVLALSDIYFVEDSPLLTASSRMAMPAFIRSLEKYKSRFLEIDGYCNSPVPNLSKSDPLFKLSVERAKVIYGYLIDAGFDPSKMSYKGLGNSVLKNDHPGTDEERRENMRVMIKVLK